MTIHQFDLQKSIINQFVSELRDTNIQKDSLRFRKNIERIGELLAYECSKTLQYENKSIVTPLGEKDSLVLKSELVLCAILRAGLPLHQGVHNYFDNAENAFISAYRNHLENSEDFEVIVNYLASPSIANKTLILIDPMLATGKTLENTYKAFEKHGVPEQIHIISVLGSEEGVAYAKKVFPKNTHLWIAAIDPILNQKGYIVPGLGDAGDLSYGLKL